MTVVVQMNINTAVFQVNLLPKFSLDTKIT